jgi:hypothetical protein
MSNKSKYPSLNIRMDETTDKLLIELEQQTGLSKREIVAYSSQPCVPCDKDFVSVLGKDDKIVKIPRGILYNSMMQKHSSYQKKNR